MYKQKYIYILILTKNMEGSITILMDSCCYVYKSVRRTNINLSNSMGAQWLSGRVLDLRRRGRGLKPHRRHCFVSLSKNINPSLVLVQPRKTGPFITERLLMGHKESNQTNKL